MKFKDFTKLDIEDNYVPNYSVSTVKELNLSTLQNNLGHCLNIIDEEVMKGYVTKLSNLPIIKPETYINAELSDIHFFKISELVYQEDEFSVDKLSMVFQTLSNRPCTLVMMLKSNGEQTDFYLGARPNGNNSAGTLFQMLKQSLLGVFPGSRISEYYDEDMKRDMQTINAGCISSVTCVADYKRDKENITNKEFIQGLEKFVYTMQGKSYTAVLIADNVGYEDLMQRKREYEQIYTQISPFANMQINFTVSDGGSISTGNSEGKSHSSSHTNTEGTSSTETDTKTHTVGSSESVGETEGKTKTHTVSNSQSDGKTDTKGETEGTSETITDGITTGKFSGKSSNLGGHLKLLNIGGGKNSGTSSNQSHSVANGKSHTYSSSESVSKTLTHGISDSNAQSYSTTKTHGTNQGNSTSKAIGNSTSNSTANTVGDTFNLVNTKTLTDTFGNSKGITLNAENMTLNMTLERIKKHLERLDECESFGMWNFAAYFIGETTAEIETAANIYKSVIAGTDSGIERSAINSWNDEAEVADLFKYISAFIHPRFVYNGFSYDGNRYIAVDPSVLVNTNELALHMGLPRHSVKGLPVVEHAQFGQEVISSKKEKNNAINLGKIYNLGRKTDTDIFLDLNSLSMHTFVTGSTGAGKSNAIYHFLSELSKKAIPFLVIEPAKGEYKEIFKDVVCYGTNPKVGRLLKINPFSFPEEIHVLEHIDRIVEIFNVCWPMYAAMPAVLKDAIEQAYITAGWDLDMSENTKVSGLFPTFDDVLRELNTTINQSDYSTDTKGDYIGALSTRVKSLTNGINGRIFVSNEIEMDDLFNRNAIVDISHVGAMETKSLIMGIIVLKLQEFRMAKANELNSSLRHVTVLEEAHNLLKKTSTEQNSESSNLVGKSVEMLTNAIAEIRTYGEGFIIADQAPNLLDTAVIRNTNTKIIMRLPECADREITGKAIALNEQQYTELSKLPTGVAAVYQNDWQEAVLCSMPKYEVWDVRDRKREVYESLKNRKEADRELLHYLLKKKLSVEEKKKTESLIMQSNVSAKIRKDLILNLSNQNFLYEWAVADFISKNFDLSDLFRGTSQCESLEELSQIIKQNISQEFAGFIEAELLKIIYYVCRVEHEKHPENMAIEQLRVEYLKEKVM